MVGHFKDGDLRKVDVIGNGRTIYYAKEDNGKMIGMNRADCAHMHIYIDSNTVSRIKFFNKPTATLFPKKDITGDMRRLDNFVWLDSLRPYHPEHTFYWGRIPDSLKHMRYRSAAERRMDSLEAEAARVKALIDSNRTKTPVPNSNGKGGSRKGLKGGKGESDKPRKNRKEQKATRNSEE